jgi:hypothetical protein
MITQEYLLECFDFDFDKGLMFWKERPRSHFETQIAYNRFKTKYAGKQVGYLNSFGYLTVCLDYKNRTLHRLIYLAFHGNVPKSLDHANGDKTDNRICNLRPATASENNRNRGKPKDNTSGFVGVQKNGKKWKASAVTNDGKKLHLGTFATPEEASKARETFCKNNYGEFYRPT